MRRALSLVLGLALAAPAAAQTLDMEMVATTRADRLLKGHFALSAWSDDGRLIAIAERQENGARSDVSIVRGPERFRK